MQKIVIQMDGAELQNRVDEVIETLRISNLDAPRAIFVLEHAICAICETNGISVERIETQESDTLN